MAKNKFPPKGLGRPEEQFQQFTYSSSNLTSAEAEALRIVKFEKTHWETAFAYVTEKVAFNMRTLIRQMRKHYWGVFDQPTDPTTGRDKIWEKLTTTFVDYMVAAYDLDTKDIQFHAKDPKVIPLVQVVRSIVHNKLEEAGFGEQLDLALRQLAIDGTVVWRTEKKNGKPHIQLVDLLNFYIDPTVDSIKQADSIIERIVMTKSEFDAQARKENWLHADLVVGVKQVSRYDTINNPGYNTNSDIPYVEVYKRTGLAKKFILTGDPKDIETVPMCIYCSGTNGNWFYHYAESRKDNEDKGYEEAWMIRVHGRWYGEGVAERLIQKQIHYNIISNIRINRAYLAQLGIFLIRKGSGITPQMLSRLATNGALSVTNIETDIKQLPMNEASEASYKDEENIYDWAQRYTGATDVLSGESLAASTPATNASIQNQNSGMRFTLIKEGIGMFLQRWLRNYGLPTMFKSVKVGDLIKMNLSAEELQALDERIVNEDLAKQIDSANQTNVFLNPDQVLQEQQRGLAKLKAQGLQRFITLLHNVDLTKFDVEITITNEEMNVSVLTSNLLQELQIVPALGLPPQIPIQILRELHDLMGLNSNLLTGITQQQGQQPGQPSQGQIPGQQVPTRPGGNPPKGQRSQNQGVIESQARTLAPTFNGL